VPDLRDQFPVGAGASYALAGKGGAAAIALSVDQLPSHNHGGNLWDPGHAHGVADPTHAHGVYDPSHTHGSWSDQNNSAHVVIWTSGAQGNYFNTTGMAYTNIGYSATGIGIYGAATGIGIYGAATGAQVYAQGSGWTHENRPPFTGMSFFIKT
jgi:microcystin-dependent protein